MSTDSPVWYDEPNPHRDCFCVNWDSDVVCLSREEAITLRRKLMDWIDAT